MSNGVGPGMLPNMSSKNLAGARLGASARDVLDAFRNRQGSAPFSGAQGNNLGAVQSMPANSSPPPFYDPNARSVTQDVGGQPGLTPDGLNLPGTMAPPPLQIADPSTPIPQPDLAARQQVFNNQVQGRWGVGPNGEVGQPNAHYLYGGAYNSAQPDQGAGGVSGSTTGGFRPDLTGQARQDAAREELLRRTGGTGIVPRSYGRGLL